MNVYSIPTVPLQDYDMGTPSNRYGTPVELGSEVQTLELTQDKAFSFTIDRRNNTDTQMAINFARALARQIKEVITPTVDQYRISKWVSGAMASHVKEEVIPNDNAYSSFLTLPWCCLTSAPLRMAGIAFVSPAFYRTIKLDAVLRSPGTRRWSLRSAAASARWTNRDCG